MYPLVACIRDIPQRKTRVLPFKKRGNRGNFISPANSTPAANISETASEYLIVIATPGLHREDFRIEVVQSIITISAKREKPILSCVNDRCEYDYTDWTRAFSLPADADAILAHAAYQNGELVIHIPRNQACKNTENKAKATIYVY